MRAKSDQPAGAALADDLVDALEDAVELRLGDPPQLRSEPADGKRADLARLHPGAPGQLRAPYLQGQGEPGARFLAGEGDAITVPERSLNGSWLTMTTGRRPACSWPTAGSSSAQPMSPLSI